MTPDFWIRVIPILYLWIYFYRFYRPFRTILNYSCVRMYFWCVCVTHQSDGTLTAYGLPRRESAPWGSGSSSSHSDGGVSSAGPRAPSLSCCHLAHGTPLGGPTPCLQHVHKPTCAGTCARTHVSGVIDRVSGVINATGISHNDLALTRTLINLLTLMMMLQNPN